VAAGWPNRPGLRVVRGGARLRGRDPPPAGSLSVLGYALSAAIILLPLAWSQWVGLVCVAGAALATWWHDGQVDAEATLILAADRGDSRSA